MFGGGQEFLLQYNKSEAKDLGYISFSFPVTPENTRLQFRGQIESNEIVVEPLNLFDFENDVTTVGLDLQHPVIDNKNNSLLLSLSYDYHRSENFILGERFEFDERFPNGIAEYQVLRFSPQWLNRSPNQVFSLKAKFNVGIDRSFFYTQLDFDFLQALSQDLLFSFRVESQFADQILFPQEQCKIGGSQFGNGAVRGYARQAFRNDNCIVGSAQVPWTAFKDEFVGWEIKLVPFLEAGYVWESEDSILPQQTLASSGVELGFSWGGFSFSAYYGLPLIDVVDELEEPFGIRGGFNWQF